ncbi:ABC transporter permease [Virgisporangium ochraceum]|uniref:ABC transporter permease n=1 Tax=Virgisporangium ochraceum TaxID=65505 RepID=A0A8J4A2Q9_9ACTN|nr:ABC transporter permease [Virgisporangium ochraceum]
MKVSFRRVVRSEWTKLVSLRSTWALLGVVAVLMVTVSGLIGWQANRDPDVDNSAPYAIARAFLSVDVASLVVGVFGILLMTGEYGSGAIRSTLAAVPTRLPVLGAKALAFVALMLPVTAAACVAALLVSQAFAEPGVRVGLTDDGVLRATAGAAVAPVAMGLIGLGIGAMVRHTAAAITVYVGVLLVLPALLPAALPDRMLDDVVPVVPVAASQSLYAVGDLGSAGDIDLLSAGPAALVMLAWVAAVLAGGAAVLLRRDA